MKIIDLRSDTVTKPTLKMREAMAKAEVGDDVYGEDPTVRRLEEMGAALVGKEAALFVPSGSMGNQVALLTHCERGDEVICDSEAHIFHYEMGAASVLAGVQLHPIKNLHEEEGISELTGHFREDIYYLPKTRLICLENTLNRTGGTVMSLEKMAVVYKIAKENGLSVHLDGARIFNAALALQCEASEIGNWCDSVMFCLSKGLGAPVGSLLAGTRQFVEKARRYRKMLGGGMRQAGVLAAAGIVALEHVHELAEDHEKAKVLAAGLQSVPGMVVDQSRVQTNMVMADVTEAPYTAAKLLAALAENGVKAGTSSRNVIRFVTHRDVSMDDIKEAVETINRVARLLSEK